MKRRCLSTCDIILTILGVAKFLQQCVWNIPAIFVLFSLRWTWMLNYSLLSIYTSMDLFSFWCAAWLYVFYFLKIVNSQHPLFLCLKSRLPSKLSWLLLGSVLVALVTGLPLPWIVYRSCHPMEAPTNDTSLVCYRPEVLSMLVLSYTLPFLIFSASATLLTASLCTHTRRMEDNSTGFSQPNLDVHFRAVKTALAFLLVYIFYFIAVIDNTFDSSQNTFTVISFLVISSYPCVHSLLLIQSNSKLRMTAIGILHRAKCRRVAGSS
ncbi:taste receptor type 2 member 40-like [Ambystoma mexicanum]|uniref:taste receptor type 2 member 40-like n=1 Tax=Ambystoma mexicanum TaxID=8296 RepID=UPI0037E7D06E